MKIYLLAREDYEGIDVAGVFSSRQKALDAIPFFEWQHDESDVLEMEVDPVLEGEKYHLMFFCCAYRPPLLVDGKNYHEGTRWMKETEASELKFSAAFYKEEEFITCLAYAKTEQQAIANAIDGLKFLNPVWQVAPYKNKPDELCESLIPRPEDVHQAWNKPYGLHRDLNQARIAILEYLKTGKILEGLVL